MFNDKKINIESDNILKDYKILCKSRISSILGKKEVFLGRAKFGIFGDGKELAQVIMSKVFKKGDFRSGYYRDQTFMISIKALTIQQFFSQLYSHVNLFAEPSSGGRMMNNHFGTRMININSSWKNFLNLNNSISDISPNASQIPRLIGISYASKLFRNNYFLKKFKKLSYNGNEIAFGTIGNAATSEGIFFESINAIGVLQLPVIISIWDDDYGISVSKKYHTTKENISKVLYGFKNSKKKLGYKIFSVNGWDYISLYKVYLKASKICRKKHIPIIIHVKEMTQPQGHSTSGSHEKYKSKNRLEWERNYDCIKKTKEFIVKNNLLNLKNIKAIERDAFIEINKQKNYAWKAFLERTKNDKEKLIKILQEIEVNKNKIYIKKLIYILKKNNNFNKLDLIKYAKKVLLILRNFKYFKKFNLLYWLKKKLKKNNIFFNSNIYNNSKKSALKVKEIKPIFSKNSFFLNGNKILKFCFDGILKKNSLVFIIGEDIGGIGDVNQSLVNLQKKHGFWRITDTSIRECTIVGQGIGAAMRGLRPIVEIQYLDYILYALQIISDDLSTLQYRTKGGQKAPLIIRTRGHRLEGVWHSGSYFAGIINNIRGIYVLVPRNMTQASGFYNTIIKSDDSALIVECLNGYNLKEKLPDNINNFTIALGTPALLKKGSDITVVTYGSMCKIAIKASNQLEKIGIFCEILDIQTLIPFDINFYILNSIKKTNKVIFIDEDLPGGTTAYMMQKVIEEQGAYYYLDSPPITITSKENRPPYSDDGNYFSKPNMEIIFDSIYEILRNFNLKKFPFIY